jgi:hypothetical protein
MKSHAMNTYGGMEADPVSPRTNWPLSSQFHAPAALPLGKENQYPLASIPGGAT